MAKPCEHLQDLTAADFPPPGTPGACEECLKEGTRWVELRECQACGHVGCCDSSRGKLGFLKGSSGSVAPFTYTGNKRM
jgi:hypothetical protein